MQTVPLKEVKEREGSKEMTKVLAVLSVLLLFGCGEYDNKTYYYYYKDSYNTAIEGCEKNGGLYKAWNTKLTEGRTNVHVVCNNGMGGSRVIKDTSGVRDD